MYVGKLSYFSLLADGSSFSDLGFPMYQIERGKGKQRIKETGNPLISFNIAVQQSWRYETVNKENIFFSSPYNDLYRRLWRIFYFQQYSYCILHASEYQYLSPETQLHHSPIWCQKSLPFFLQMESVIHRVCRPRTTSVNHTRPNLNKSMTCWIILELLLYVCLYLGYCLLLR